MDIRDLYDLCVVQYKYSKSELSSRTLWLSVWDWDRFGRNQFLGEVRLPLSSLDLTDTTDQWYSLQDKVSTSTRKYDLTIPSSCPGHIQKLGGPGDEATNL